MPTAEITRLTRFSVPEILSRFRGRMSYRKFDYWVRTGQMTIRQGATGSGSRRTISGAEYLALSDLVDEHERIAALLTRVTSGAYYAERLAIYESECP